MGSDITEFLLQVLQLISILASCEESDFVAISEGRLVVISILAPCVGSDIFEFFSIHTADKFQFSFLAWGAMYLSSVE